MTFFFFNSSCINLSFECCHTIARSLFSESAHQQLSIYPHSGKSDQSITFAPHCIHGSAVISMHTTCVHNKADPTGLKHRPSPCLLFILVSPKSSKRKLHNWRRLLQLKYGLTAELCLPFTFLFIIPIPSKELLRMVFLSLCAALEQLK